MEKLNIKNPFGAPVYREARVSSTMDVSRRLAGAGETSGTVITADFQENGRGRVRSRPWKMDSSVNLAFTIFLDFGGLTRLPPALTLRTGLAVSLAIEDFAPALGGLVKVKWPNDIMIQCPGGAGKAAGILTEADGARVYTGIGVNLGQKEFPPEYRDKAVSIALALERMGAGEAAEKMTTEKITIERFDLLEKILARLHRELSDGGNDWRSRLEARLFKKGERVRFLSGGADSATPVTGLLQGAGPGGELLIVPDGESRAAAFVSGELDVYG